jgi:hypothetical protein
MPSVTLDDAEMFNFYCVQNYKECREVETGEDGREKQKGEEGGGRGVKGGKQRAVAVGLVKTVDQWTNEGCWP